MLPEKWDRQADVVIVGTGYSGLAAALRDRHAVRAQAAGASNLGVDYDEMEEALRVTFLLAGMPAYTYGRTAIDDFMKK